MRKIITVFEIMKQQIMGLPFLTANFQSFYFKQPYKSVLSIILIVP